MDVEETDKMGCNGASYHPREIRKEITSVNGFRPFKSLSKAEHYDQGVGPKCTLVAITKAVLEACKQDNILVRFESLLAKLDDWVVSV